MNASEFFILPASLSRFSAFFHGNVAPWEWLRKIGPAMEAAAVSGPPPSIPSGVHLEGRVWLDGTVKLPAHATIIGPAYIGAHTEIRPGAFIRGNVIVGEHCVLGNSCEFKNCVLMDGVQVPHFSYVGDSILGNRAHLGAGAICSNLRLDQGEVMAKLPSGPVPTGLRKFGAILGDHAEVGCNAVLNPGTLLGPRSRVMPAISFGGYLPAGHLARVRSTVSILPAEI
ncbi:MAG TPA: UDP-N-acetylglucosamine diphosphorylase [Candidatus Didemnitutus sp.]